MHKRPINYSKEHTTLKVTSFVLNERQQYYLFSARQKTTSHVPLVSPDPRPVGGKRTRDYFCVFISFYQSASPAALSPGFCFSSVLNFLIL